MNKDHSAYLKLILDAFPKIKPFTRGVTEASFLTDSKTQSAVIMQLQVVGELVKKVTAPMKKDINIPWKKMAGLRDLVSHDYFKLDLSIIWKTASESIFEAESKITEYLKNSEKNK